MKKNNGQKKTILSKTPLVKKRRSIAIKAITMLLMSVILFCISAYAEMTTITVKDQDGNVINVNTDMTTTESLSQYRKMFYLENYELLQVSYVVYNEINGNIRSYNLLSTEENLDGQITVRYLLFANMTNITPTKIVNETTGEIIIEIDDENGITYGVVKEKWLELIQPLQNNDFSEYITIEPPVYESFLDKARAMFGLLWEMVTNTFNWLVSPTVIPFFLIGTALSLLFIGIIICKRLFWGR